ncbi:hypothetical protein ACJX0J_026874, partial [Zea mays]
NGPAKDMIAFVEVVFSCKGQSFATFNDVSKFDPKTLDDRVLIYDVREENIDGFKEPLFIQTSQHVMASFTAAQAADEDGRGLDAQARPGLGSAARWAMGRWDRE